MVFKEYWTDFWWVMLKFVWCKNLNRILTFQNGFGNDVRLKEANNKAHRNRYSSKSLIITCDIEIQDFQKKIERRTK